MDTRDLRVTTTELMGPNMNRLQGLATAAAVVGLILVAAGWFTAPMFGQKPAVVFQSYLFSYIFWIGISIGSLGLLMLHHVVGGGWGFVIRRFLEAACSPVAFLAMALLFIPIALTLFPNIVQALYSAEVPPLIGTEPHHGWAHPEASHDPILQQKAPYLNVPRFLGFAVAYFAIWIFFSSRLIALGRTQDERADLGVTESLNKWGAGGILVLVLSVTFMAVDWVMSLEPHWFSSIFGLLFLASQALSTLALMIILVAYLAGNTNLLRRVPDGYFRDLGNLMLATVLLWAYMSFSQYLIIYSGNLAEEVPWYIARTRGAWYIVPAILVLLHFFVPFLSLLLASHWKRRPGKLAVIAGLILVARFIDLFWIVVPTFRQNLYFNPADLGAPLLLGGVWLLVFVSQLKDRPVVPLHDPRFIEGLAAHQHAHEVVSHG